MKPLFFYKAVLSITIIITSNKVRANERGVLFNLAEFLFSKDGLSYTELEKKSDHLRKIYYDCGVDLKTCFGSKENSNTDSTSYNFSLLELLAEGCEGNIYKKTITFEKDYPIKKTILNEKIIFSKDERYKKLNLNIKKNYVHSQFKTPSSLSNSLYHLLGDSDLTPSRSNPFPNIIPSKIYTKTDTNSSRRSPRFTHLRQRTYSVRENSESNLEVAIMGIFFESISHEQTMSTEYHLKCVVKKWHELNKSNNMNHKDTIENQ